MKLTMVLSNSDRRRFVVGILATLAAGALFIAAAQAQSGNTFKARLDEVSELAALSQKFLQDSGKAAGLGCDTLATTIA